MTIKILILVWIYVDIKNWKTDHCGEWGGGIIKNQFDLYAIISREQGFEIS